MHREDFKGMTKEQCAKRMAFYLSEVNALLIHPFREENGWNLGIAQIPHDEFVAAMIESMNSSLERLEDAIGKVLTAVHL